MRLADVPRARLSDLRRSHEALLFDAYGVLLYREGPLPGAREVVTELNRSQQPYLIVSNDASRTPEHASARYRALGLEIPEERILSSGQVLVPYYASEGLEGLRSAVLGPPDSLELVRRAGGVPCLPDDDTDADALLVCDEADFPLLSCLDAALTLAMRRASGPRPLRMILPNPDLVYLRANDTYGVTAGGLALIIEAALGLRYPDRDDLRFVRLGKPERYLFDEAVRRLGTRSIVMIGDQLLTDVAGARRAGLSAALIGTGLTELRDDLPLPPEAVPTHVLPDLLG
jgi:HAD superfamily hydrolase (TIGR01450 family)